MGEYILKASQDHEWYAIWSTYTNCVIYQFPTRKDALEYLQRPITLHDGSVLSRPLTGNFTPEARLQRADIYGTSAIVPRSHGWDSDSMLFVHDTPQKPGAGFWTLPRNRLLDYCRLRHVGAYEEAQELLEFKSDPDD